MHPILFRIGSFYVGTYGVMIVIGLAAALALGLHYAKLRGIPADFCYDLAFVGLLTGFLGARILFILLNFEQFKHDPIGMIFSRTGFVFMGGFAAAAGAAIFFIRRRQLPMWEVGDIAAPSLALAHGFGRIGCFLAGCCYGDLCPDRFPLGVSFPHVVDERGETLFSYAFEDQLHRGLIDTAATASARVYPTQLFESAANFAICLVLVYLWRRRKFPGQIFLYYLMFYGLVRFGLEYLRGDVDRGVWFGGLLSTSQIFSLAAIGAAAILWNVLKPRRPVRGAKPAHGK